LRGLSVVTFVNICESIIVFETSSIETIETIGAVGGKEKETCRNTWEPSLESIPHGIRSRTLKMDALN
jgi:hypothetical protein